MAARADFAHVVDDRADGRSSMTAFAPGVSVALIFRCKNRGGGGCSPAQAKAGQCS